MKVNWNSRGMGERLETKNLPWERVWILLETT